MYIPTIKYRCLFHGHLFVSILRIQTCERFIHKILEIDARSKKNQNYRSWNILWYLYLVRWLPSKHFFSNSNHNFVIHIETINKYYSAFSTFYCGHCIIIYSPWPKIFCLSRQWYIATKYTLYLFNNLLIHNNIQVHKSLLIFLLLLGRF